MTVGQVQKRIPARPGSKRLGFDEVLASRRPAVYEDFGDSLLYLDGEVFILGDIDPGSDAAAMAPVLDARVLVHAVGVETGWRHEADCDCSCCAAHPA